MASLTDAAAIADLHNLPGYRWGTMRLPYHSVEEIRRGIEQQPADVRSLVAVLDGMVVGDIALLPAKGRRAHVATLGMGVHDDHTRRGIGRALLGEAIGIADDWLNLPFILVKDGYTEKTEKEIKHDELINDFIGFNKIIEKYL